MAVKALDVLVGLAAIACYGLAYFVSIICATRSLVWLSSGIGVRVPFMFFRLKVLFPQKLPTACVVTRAAVKTRFRLPVTKRIFPLSRNAHRMLIENMPKPFSTEPCSIYARLLCCLNLP